MSKLDLEEVPKWFEKVVDAVTEFVSAGPNGLEWEAHKEDDDATLWCVHIGPISDEMEDGAEEWDKVHVHVTSVLKNLAPLLEEVSCESDEMFVAFEGVCKEGPKERVRLLVQYVPLGEGDDDDGEGDDLPKPFDPPEPTKKSSEMLN